MPSERLTSPHVLSIVAANLNHNHELVPGALSCFMRERRSVTDEDMAVVKRMLSVGFRQCEIMRLLVYASGGHDRVGFLLKDLNNRKVRDEGADNCGWFETGYAYLLSRHGCDEGIHWLTYCQGHFWAELRSTQRCERMHAFMKGYLKTTHKVHEFLHHYERAVTDLRHKESMEDYNSAVQAYELRTMLRSLEAHASRIYTLTSFRKVQLQMQRADATTK
ncbi:hypothetical protein MLD38_005368 [Melastoma candidum]|uniref:Uncharacterized protein n=1 Tax=Melastoma candidum TaxID=119954 RepID=A0ACB9S9W2_9MYRT|nr:hypothetical protein MLD38_005368 [Melastoma candidum]